MGAWALGASAGGFGLNPPETFALEDDPDWLL